jgi:hypothetical protein
MSEYFDKFAPHLRQIIADTAWQSRPVEIEAATDQRYVVNRGALLAAEAHLEQHYA